MPQVIYIDPETGQRQQRTFPYTEEGQQDAAAFARSVQGRVLAVSRPSEESTPT